MLDAEGQSSMLDWAGLKTGDVVLVRHPDPDAVADGIAWFQGDGAATHNACYIGDGRLIEAESVGVVEARLEKYRGCRVTVRRLKTGLSMAQETRAVEFWLGQVGSRYDFRLLLGLAALNILRRLGWSWALRRIPNILGERDAYICSELWVDGVRAAGAAVFPGVPSGNLQPIDLYRDQEWLETVSEHDPAG